MATCLCISQLRRFKYKQDVMINDGRLFPRERRGLSEVADGKPLKIVEENKNIMCERVYP